MNFSEEISQLKKASRLRSADEYGPISSVDEASSDSIIAVRQSLEFACSFISHALVWRDRAAASLVKFTITDCRDSLRKVGYTFVRPMPVSHASRTKYRSVARQTHPATVLSRSRVPQKLHAINRFVSISQSIS